MGTRGRCFCLLIAFGLWMGFSPLNAQKDNLGPEEMLQIEHQSPQWPDIAAHLPDPTTASAEKLETAADVLRARRFPQSAMMYYKYALQHGGREVPLLNKIGVTELELRHTAQARAYFQRVVKLKKKSAEGWNNLGAVEYLDRRLGSAISDYRRAIKLDKKTAVYHSNLGTAYLEQKDFAGARKEYGIALVFY